MGVIIKLNSTELVTKFLKKNSIENFLFVLVSDHIKTKHTYDNVVHIKNLMPSREVMKHYESSHISEEYATKYMKMVLKHDLNFNIITAIVHEALVNDVNVALICSDIEEKYNYIDLLSYFIEENFGISILSYKKYKKSNGSVCYDMGSAVKKLNKHIKTHKTDDLATLRKKDQILKEELKAELEKMEKKKLFKYCRGEGLQVTKDSKRKDMVYDCLSFFDGYILIK